MRVLASSVQSLAMWPSPPQLRQISGSGQSALKKGTLIEAGTETELLEEWSDIKIVSFTKQEKELLIQPFSHQSERLDWTLVVSQLKQ